MAGCDQWTASKVWKTAYIRFMSNRMKIMAALIAFAAPVVPAHAVDLMSGEKPGSAASSNYPPPETKSSGAPEVTPRKTYVPGHKSKYGGFVPGHYEEGSPPPPLAPGEKSQGYVPGHHDADGRYIPGHPK